MPLGTRKTGPGRCLLWWWGGMWHAHHRLASCGRSGKGSQQRSWWHKVTKQNIPNLHCNTSVGPEVSDQCEFSSQPPQHGHTPTSSESTTSSHHPSKQQAARYEGHCWHCAWKTSLAVAHPPGSTCSSWCAILWQTQVCGVPWICVLGTPLIHIYPSQAPEFLHHLYGRTAGAEPHLSPKSSPSSNSSSSFLPILQAHQLHHAASSPMA